MSLPFLGTGLETPNKRCAKAASLPQSGRAQAHPKELHFKIPTRTELFLKNYFASGSSFF